MKNGVPYDVAFALEDEERLAHAVVFGKFEGQQFDWREMRWVRDA